MEVGKTISHALALVRKNKVLWVLGFLAALGSSGGSGGNINLPSRSSSSAPSGSATELSEGLDNFFALFENPQFQMVLVVLLCILVVLGIVLAVVGFIAQGGLIEGVSQLETGGSTTFRAAWSGGIRSFWSRFGMALLLNLPIFFIYIGFIVVGLLVFGGAVASSISSGGRNGTSNFEALFASFGVVFLCLACVFILFVIVYSVAVAGIYVYGERAIVLDNVGVIDAIKLGWRMFRDNLGNTIVIALIMWVIGIVSGLLLLAISAPFFLPLVFRAFNSPEGFQFDAVTIGVGLLAFLVLIIVGAIMGALIQAFDSTTWTLAYRQLTGRPLRQDGDSVVNLSSPPSNTL